MILEFWESSVGKPYVLDFLEEIKDQTEKPKIVKRIEFLKDWDYVQLFKTQLIKKFKGGNSLGLHEYIISLKVEYRITFIIRNNVCYLLSGFIKKDERTRPKEIAKAKARAKEVDWFIKS